MINLVEAIPENMSSLMARQSDQGLAQRAVLDGLFLITEWNDFRHPDFERMKSMMKAPVIFDGRNVFDPSRVREKGFTYFSVGRR